MNRPKENKIQKEQRIVSSMIDLYMEKHLDSSDSLSREKCIELKNYAIMRLKRCQFGENKPACKSCKVHCYSPDKRKDIKIIMRFSGPRVFFRNPIESLKHIF